MSLPVLKKTCRRSEYTRQRGVMLSSPVHAGSGAGPHHIQCECNFRPTSYCSFHRMPIRAYTWSTEGYSNWTTTPKTGLICQLP